jgi:hypothetical protein
MVRLIGFQAIIFMNGMLLPPLADYVMNVLLYDKSEYIRHTVAKTLAYWGKLVYFGSACVNHESPFDGYYLSDKEPGFQSPKHVREKLVSRIKGSKELEKLMTTKSK